MNNEPVLLQHLSDGICTLTLNRPDKFNSLSEALLDELAAALEKANASEDVRVVVLEANGKAFCAGHDLKEMMQQQQEAYYRDLFARCTRVMKGLVDLSKPVIAKVQGMATAAGCQLVAACDLAIASDNATFAVSGIRLGLFCSTPSVALSRNLSRKRAFEMLFTGDFISAEEAAENGLVNRVVAHDNLDQAVEDLCRRIIKHPPVAVETGKKLFYQQLESNLEQAYQTAGETMARNMMADDTLEGVQAFLDKRPPDWTHSA